MFSAQTEESIYTSSFLLAASHKFDLFQREYRSSLLYPEGLPAHLPFRYWLCAETAFLLAIFGIMYVAVVKL
jgi:hypothetical protein